jgi:hypothetical protein
MERVRDLSCGLRFASFAEEARTGFESVKQCVRREPLRGGLGKTIGESVALSGLKR